MSAYDRPTQRKPDKGRRSRRQVNKGGHSSQHRAGAAPDDDLLELRLPPNSLYQSVVRAVTTVLAGEMSFTYDDVIQLRVAAAEVFDLAVLAAGPQAPEQVVVQFQTYPDHIEIAASCDHQSLTDYVSSPGGQESVVLLQSLMDQAEIGTVGRPDQIRIVKHK